MANDDRPRGFVPVGHMSGGEIRCRSYKVADGTSIYKGDVLCFGDAGEVTIAAAGGHQMVGVAAETVLTPTSEDILVWDDPNIIYEVQGYSSVTFTEGEGIGLFADHVANAGDTTYNISRQELNSPTVQEPGVTAAATFKIIGKVDRPGNAWGEHVKLLVKFYEHFTVPTMS